MKKIIMTTEGVKAKIEELTQQIKVINATPGNIIDFTTASKMTRNLSELREIYQVELERRL